MIYNVNEINKKIIKLGMQIDQIETFTKGSNDVESEYEDNDEKDLIDY